MRGTANINTARIVVDMSSRIAELQPSAAPLTVLTKRIATDAVYNYKFEWLEDDLMSRWTAIDNSSTAYTASSDELVVDDASIIAVGDIIKSVATGEMMNVTAVDVDAREITVARGYGETAAHADSVANDAKLLVVGNASMQGAGAPAEKYVNTINTYNYTQIFRTPFAVTGTLDKMKLYGGNELKRQQKKKGIEHKKSIEYAFIFGERKLDVTGEQPKTTTAGVYTFLAGTDNVVTKPRNLATLEAEFDAWCQDLFTYGSDEKTLFACPLLISKINSWAKGKLEIIQADKDRTYGLNIIRYLTPHGMLNIVRHPLFVQGYDGLSIALDMDNVKYRPLRGRDTTLRTNIQNNDADGRKDEYLTEAGLEIKLPKTHGMFILGPESP